MEIDYLKEARKAFNEAHMDKNPLENYIKAEFSPDLHRLRYIQSGRQRTCFHDAKGNKEQDSNPFRLQGLSSGSNK
jgi:hypothetical protein